jgi:hypothetical protein
VGRHLDTIVRAMDAGEINRTATSVFMAMEADRLDQKEEIAAAFKGMDSQFVLVMRQVLDHFLFHLTNHNMDGDGI